MVRIVAIVILSLTLFRSMAANYSLASDGTTQFAIVTPAEPDEYEVFAASELSRYLQKISGVEFMVQNGGDVPPKSIIVAQVGNLDALTSIPSELELLDESFAIIPRENQIVLAGARGRALLYAVYDFLNAAGCGWLAPELAFYRDSAEFVPEQESLSISLSKPKISKPDLAIRKLYVEEGHSHTVQNLRQIIEWMPKVGYNTLVIPTDYQNRGRVKWDNWRDELTPELARRDLVIEVGGHGYQNFLNSKMDGGKLFEQHAEWFGMDENGKRRQDKARVFCTTNPDAVKFVTDAFLKYIKERPEILIYDFWPPDGAKWCECPKCLAAGSPSDRQAILVNNLKNEVDKVRPDLRLEIIAYASYLNPPDKVQLHPSVLVDFCPISQNFDHQINDPDGDNNSTYVISLKSWREEFSGDISIYSYYRKYAWDSLPVVIPHYMQKDLRFYKTLPVQGVSTYAEPGDWYTYELNHYVLGHLAWDVEADVDELVKEFCAARYGRHAGLAREAFGLLEEVVRKYGGVPHSKWKTAQEIGKAAKRMRAMSENVAEASGKTHEQTLNHHMRRLSLMCEYAARDLELRTLAAESAPEEEIRNRAKDLHGWLHENRDAGVFMLSNDRLKLDTMIRRHYTRPD